MAKKKEKIVVDPYANSFEYKERRADGWPLCPFCGLDELWSFDQTESHIVGCLFCSWFPKIDMAEKRVALCEMIGIRNPEKQMEYLISKGLTK